LIKVTIKRLLKELSARIPELDWQLGKLGPSFSFDKSIAYTLPKGLFKVTYNALSSEYIAEIKDDIASLPGYTYDEHNMQTILYIVNKIHQKIHTLVTIFAHHNRLKSLDENTDFFINKLTSYHKRLQPLEDMVAMLTEQKKALIYLLKSNKHYTAIARLNLVCELNELEKQLVIASKAYIRAKNS
jgi:hypothetical protein